MGTVRKRQPDELTKLLQRFRGELSQQRVAELSDGKLTYGMLANIEAGTRNMTEDKQKVFAKVVKLTAADKELLKEAALDRKVKTDLPQRVERLEADVKAMKSDVRLILGTLKAKPAAR